MIHSNKKWFRTGLFLALLFVFSSASAQKFTIKGEVVDTLGLGLPSASIMLLTSGDSIISTFTTTNNDGTFEIPSVSPGKYILQVSYVGFNGHDQNLNLEKGEAQEKNLGKIIMKERSNQLGGVDVIGEAAPIVLKEDTIEYNANSFTVRPDGKVEDLLKKLPGVEVDKDGTVKAQGEEVTKVFVDGKEFFGDDPKTATKNLPADAIDKVQVYDKKSEFSEFTGFDDGERSKTINLILKKDKKKGYFGNVAAGYGTEERYEGRANVNRFAQKYQLSGIGSINNTNQQGFSWDDYISFMGGVRNAYSGGGGGIPINFGMSDGFMQAQGAGLNYNFFPNKKVDFNSSYFYNGMDHNIERTSYRETYLDTGTFFNKDTTIQNNKSTGHKMNFKLRLRPDSIQDISFRGSGNLNLNNAVSNSSQTTIGTEGDLSNQVTNSFTTNADNLAFNGSAAYRRKFKNRGRALAVELSGNSGSNVGDDDLFTESFVYTDGILSSRDSVDQRQASNQGQYSYDVELTYIEPIGKREFLKFDMDYHKDMTDFARDYYDNFPGSDPEEVFNDSLSNWYNKGYDYSRGILTLRIVRDKLQLTFGGAAQISTLEGDLSDNSVIFKKFTNFLPSMQARYEFSRSNRLTLNYRTSVSAPSIEQLRPTIDNNDPLNIYVGNPDLKAQEIHRVSLGIMNYSQFTFTSVFANIAFTYTKDKIKNSTFTNSNFVRTTMPVNVDNDVSVNSFVGFNTPFKPLKVKFNANVNSMYGRGITPVNGLNNATTTFINTFDVGLQSYFKDEIISLEAGVELTHNDISFSESRTNDQTYVNTTYYSTLDLYFGEKWTLEAELDYAIYGDQGQGKQEVPIIKAGVSRAIFGTKGRLRLSGFDLLNKNVGYNRTSQLNYYQEENVRSLGRFFMLTFSYNFTMVGK